MPTPPKHSTTNINPNFLWGFGSKERVGGVYEYSFNEKETDNEIKGVGNSLDFGARIYDSRLGRFLSVDIFAFKFPYYSSYLFAGDTPIRAIDLQGDSIYIIGGNSLLFYVFETLLKTESGKELIKKYAHSTTEHIFITIDALPPNIYPNAGGVTSYNDSRGIVDVFTFKSVPRKVIEKAVGGRIKMLRNFGDIDFSNFKRQNAKLHFIVLKKELFDREIKSIPSWKLKALAEIVYHEIKAHIDLHANSAEEEHELYGNEGGGFLGSFPKQNTPANDIFNELKNVDVKNIKSEKPPNKIDYSKLNNITKYNEKTKD